MIVDALVEVSPGGLARRLGSVVEELLELGVRRLERGSVAVGPRRTWISARRLLDEAPRSRSKWLQRAAGLPKSAVQALGAALETAVSEDAVCAALAGIGDGATQAARSGLAIDARVDRRRSGSHYTPEALAETVVARALAPLVTDRTSAEIRGLRICDPAMGSGVFLVAAAEFVAAELARAWQREGRADAVPTALATVVSECLYGVDRNPVATDLARICLARLASQSGSPPDLSAHLRSGDALVGRSGTGGGAHPPAPPFDWPREFPAVFGEHGGFDACVGNPPWVAYVGRAAQPLARELARYYEATNPAFHSYRTLHGLFVRRAAELLRPGGRLGLVVPTSVADLAGYAPTREAHDALSDVDPELDDFGDGAFEGVFQPCMALTSTRREGARTAAGGIWQLQRPDLDAVARGLLSRLDTLPKLRAELFGERGFQTTGDDLAHLRKLPGPEPPFVVPIREGSDVAEFCTRPARTFLDPRGLRGRFRPEAEWRAVGVLIRQTARYPMATLSDGLPFRNSVLAGFADGTWTAPALAAYLNANLVRWFHYTRHRDARQGMPQLKIGHLRALPEVPEDCRAGLHALGSVLGARNTGILEPERADLDTIVEDAFALSGQERDLVATWARRHPVPVSRR